ncbi:MAG: TetR family transcriptional regulator C-terminal domain-containing protein [Acidobacteriota bacterium]|nr:TetR family transcriptional regulator C-terminal domain-containing protein [Acidobacteriota bacterium]
MAAVTERGRRTQERILASAAALIHERGVRATSVDEVLAASQTGKSQFYHYFAGKDELGRAVLAYQLERLLAEQRPLLERLDSFEGIEDWFAFILDLHRRRGFLGGCPIGSLAAEAADEDPKLREALAAAFDAWQSFLRAGLEAMRARGELRPDADPDALAEATMAAIQGGILLATTKKREQPLASALAAALVALRSYIADMDPRTSPARAAP